jgi:glyoxylase-like metal-dependent hydrolase (beta-lactamase superfamily II)
MRPPEVAAGVFRLGTKWVNFYLLVDQGEATLIDAGYPRYWSQITQALGELRLPQGAVSAVVVTHHHVDHVGTAERRRRAGATVYVHAADAEIVRGERRSHVPHGFYRQSWRPSMARYLAHTVAAGGARYCPVAQVAAVSGDTELDVPGRPRVISTPGHTAGHCSVAVEDRGAAIESRLNAAETRLRRAPAPARALAASPRSTGRRARTEPSRRRRRRAGRARQAPARGPR